MMSFKVRAIQYPIRSSFSRSMHYHTNCRARDILRISILLNGYNRVLHKRLKSPENRAFKEWRFQREPSLFYFREKYETGCCMRFSGYCMQVYAFAYSLDRLAYSREVYAYSRDGLAYSRVQTCVQYRCSVRSQKGADLYVEN